MEEYFSKPKEVFHKNGLLFNNLSPFPKIYFYLWNIGKYLSTIFPEILNSIFLATSQIRICDRYFPQTKDRRSGYQIHILRISNKFVKGYISLLISYCKGRGKQSEDCGSILEDLYISSFGEVHEYILTSSFFHFVCSASISFLSKFMYTQW